MINFLLKYMGTYGLLAILAVAIVTPTYFFFTSQQEMRQEPSAEKQDVSNKEKVAEKTVLTEKTKESADGTSDESKQKDPSKQENKGALEQVDSVSVDIFRVDEFGNIISAGKVSKEAKIEILADNKKIIGADKTEADGSFVIFGKVQSTGLVQTVKIRD